MPSCSTPHGVNIASMYYLWVSYNVGVLMILIIRRQLTPGWTLIRNKLNQDSLRIGKLDCEGSPENAGLH